MRNQYEKAQKHRERAHKCHAPLPTRHAKSKEGPNSSCHHGPWDNPGSGFTPPTTSQAKQTKPLSPTQLQRSQAAHSTAQKPKAPQTPTGCRPPKDEAGLERAAGKALSSAAGPKPGKRPPAKGKKQKESPEEEKQNNRLGCRPKPGKRPWSITN